MIVLVALIASLGHLCSVEAHATGAGHEGPAFALAAALGDGHDHGRVHGAPCLERRGAVSSASASEPRAAEAGSVAAVTAVTLSDAVTSRLSRSRPTISPPLFLLHRSLLI